MAAQEDPAWLRKQAQKFEFEFDAADKDKSGALSSEELLRVLATVGFKGTQEEGLAIFGQYDRSRDQKVTRTEYINCMKALPKLTRKEFVLRCAFKILDKDGSERLSRSELMDAVSETELPSDRISDLLIELTRGGDDKVDYEEFLRVFGVEQTACVMGQVFTNLDTDNSGFLSKTEILDSIRDSPELKINADKISDLLIAHVKDDDGKISYTEFVQVWLKEKEPKA